MTTMRMLRYVALVLATMLLPGCFWGFFDGTVQVRNDTGRTIRVEAIIGSGAGDVLPHQRIKSGEADIFPVHGGAFRPRVKISCQGRMKTIPFRLNFLGWAEVTVDEEDFPPTAHG